MGGTSVSSSETPALRLPDTWWDYILLAEIHKPHMAYPLYPFTPSWQNHDMLVLGRWALRTQGFGDGRGSHVSHLIKAFFFQPGQQGSPMPPSGWTQRGLGAGLERALWGDPLWSGHRVMAVRCWFWVLCL